jgi:hypothetical protein
MLGDGKIFSCLHNIFEAAQLQADTTRFNHTVICIIDLYLFNKMYIYIY